MNILKKHIEYLKDNPKGYWFKRKLYGWGWTPSTWQGWVVTLVYILVVVIFSLTLDENSPKREVFFTFVLPFVLLTFTFLRIVYKKGEKPKWTWGLKDAEKNKENNY